MTQIGVVCTIATMNRTGMIVLLVLASDVVAVVQTVQSLAAVVEELKMIRRGGIPSCILNSKHPVSLLNNSRQRRSLGIG